MESVTKQLRKLGLVTEKAAREAEAEKTLDSEGQNTSGTLPSAVTLKELADAKSIRQFRTLASSFLLQTQLNWISEVIHLAHLFNKDKARQKLLWQLYSVRNGLADVPPEKRRAYITKAMRSKNPKP